MATNLASPGHAPPRCIFGLVDERPPRPDDLSERHQAVSAR
jgi:hypothetical protein